jgi:Mg/Co/Ni transporter MgtE
VYDAPGSNLPADEQDCDPNPQFKKRASVRAVAAIAQEQEASIAQADECLNATERSAVRALTRGDDDVAALQYLHPDPG